VELIKKMHKAIAVIQFKLEGQAVKRNPHYRMEDRLLLDKINFEKGTITINGKEYELLDKNFPTVDPADPYKLTEEEEEVMYKLRTSIKNSKRLQKHIEFLFSHGSMYLTFNSNLLYHGCIPMNKEGEFETFKVNDYEVSGKQLCDRFEIAVRRGFQHRYSNKYSQENLDYFWYLWCGEHSPLFGKKKMTTFERYFIADKETHKEERNSYYDLVYNGEEYVNKILKEFGLDPGNSHIVNGHIPVKVKKGESPIKANGKLFVIDGGMSKPYQKVTGVAGYTLIFNSYGLVLVEHQKFESRQKAIEEEVDIISNRIFIETKAKRKRVRDTDVGKEIEAQIADLKLLLAAYKKGLIKETI
jgi:fructose-1,6-bisphosphatase-3